MSMMRDVRKVLDSVNLPYEIEPGSKHHKIYLAGKRITVLSMCRNLSGDVPMAHFKATVKRRLRELGVNYKDNHLLHGR